MIIDIIMLSKAKNDDLKDMTERCLKSLIDSAVDIKFNIIVIEGTPTEYENVQTVHNYGRFNYNKFMNQGTSLCNNEYIVFANNDLEFTKGWADRLINAMQTNNIEIASPLCRLLHGNKLIPEQLIEGYAIREIFAGWCFCLKRDLYNQMNGLDEDFEFWCADDSVIEQIKLLGKKHFLITDSIVNHISDRTGSYMSENEKDYYKVKQVQKFNAKYNRNNFGWGTGDYVRAS